MIIKEGLQDKEYIQNRTEGYEELEKLVEAYPPERAGEICGVAPEDIVKAARMYAEGEKAGIFYAMGITAQLGTGHVMAIANLAMLCGNVGIESGGVNP